MNKKLKEDEAASELIAQIGGLWSLVTMLNGVSAGKTITIKAGNAHHAKLFELTILWDSLVTKEIAHRAKRRMNRKRSDSPRARAAANLAERKREKADALSLKFLQVRHPELVSKYEELLTRRTEK